MSGGIDPDHGGQRRLPAKSGGMDGELFQADLNLALVLRRNEFFRSGRDIVIHDGVPGFGWNQRRFREETRCQQDVEVLEGFAGRRRQAVEAGHLGQCLLAPRALIQHFRLRHQMTSLAIDLRRLTAVRKWPGRQNLLAVGWRRGLFLGRFRLASGQRQTAQAGGQQQSSKRHHFGRIRSGAQAARGQKLPGAAWRTRPS